MEDFAAIAQNWLDREDRITRSDRLARLEWLAVRSSAVDAVQYAGGWMSKYLFEEARYCFAYGQFMATIILGLAFIERTLAALFLATGRDDLERASLSTLLHHASSVGWLTTADAASLDALRAVRNPIAHFRAPLTPDAIELRSLTLDETPYRILEADARSVMDAVFRIHARQPE